ncbi:MAG: DUF2799 domain-containing protein [Bdellovibrionales bacterium]|nr:DUF2799 domain-containing protein [Bdellovibrionales bacterium]
MRRLSSVLLGLMLICGLSGCASYFMRKDCEKTNWYQYGYDVAMSGKRLDADDKIKQCQKVEAKMSFSELDTGFKAGMSKYCTGDNVFAVGKAGKPFSYDMCDGESARKMRAQYEKGLAVFCTTSNAYRFGADGGLYLNVCPKEVENAWLTEYRKGRKIHLAAVIEEKEREVTRLSQELSRLENQRNILNMRQASLLNRTVLKREQVLDARTGTYREQVSQVPDESARQQSDRLQTEISGVDYDIKRTREKYESLTSEVSKLRTEMVAL